MELPSLKHFSLAGGTALSLKFGHRSSVDLDLFHHEKFDSDIIENELRQTLMTIFFTRKDTGILVYFAS